MYTKLELVTIFSSTKTLDELQKVCDIIMWLIDEKLIKGTDFLKKAAHVAFRRINKIDSYE